MMRKFHKLAVCKISCLLSFALIVTTLMVLPSYSQEDDLLTVEQIMKAIITPMTSTIWGAYEVQTDAQWLELENAAYTVIAAGNLLKTAGVDASNDDWQQFNEQMITAARAALTAISSQDEEALFNAGNDQLYPPCESCHQKYMAQ